MGNRHHISASILLCVSMMAAAPFDSAPLIVDIPASSARLPGVRGITVAPIEDSQLGNVGYGSARCVESLAEVAAVGSTWISITPFGRMDNLRDTFILHDFEIPVETNMKLIGKTVAAAREKRLKVAIIPHIYVMNGEWRGDIDPGSPQGWKQWFAAYTAYLLRYAKLAQEVHADMFSIGVEFKSSTNYRQDLWRQLIRDVRRVYAGPLTYSANWDEVAQVPFWDALDFIGINAFWPLAKKPGDGYDVMRSSMERIAADLEGYSWYYNKPVLFTEMGIKSAADSALAPWEWPEHLSDQKSNELYQAEAYDAIIDVMSSKPWWAGMFLWKYFADPFDETQENRSGFSPRNKLAESSLAQQLGSPWQFQEIEWDKPACIPNVKEQ